MLNLKSLRQMAGPRAVALTASLCLAACQEAPRHDGIKSVLAMFAATESPPDPTDSLPCQLDLVADLPLHKVGGHYEVAVVVNGKPALLLLDTGAFRTMLTSAAADRLALRKSRIEVGHTVSGLGGERRAQVYVSDDLQVGMLRGKNWSFLVTDLGLERISPNVDGLLGADFLSRYDVDFNMPGGRVALYSPEHDCSRPSAYLQGPLYQVTIGRTAVPLNEKTAALVKAKFGEMHATYGTPYLYVTIGGQTLLAEIDSGAPQNLLFPSGMRKLKLGAAEFAGDARIRTGGLGPDNVPAIHHVVDEVDIGDLGIQHVPFAVLKDGVGHGGPDLLLGVDVLTRIHFWLSHTSGTLIMQYPPRPSPPPPQTSKPPSAS